MELPRGLPPLHERGVGEQHFALPASRWSTAAMLIGVRWWLPRSRTTLPKRGRRVGADGWLFRKAAGRPMRTIERDCQVETSLPWPAGEGKGSERECAHSPSTYRLF